MKRPWGARAAWLVAVGLVAGPAAYGAAVEPPTGEAPPPLVGTIREVGERTFEPTIGVDGTGAIYFSVARQPGVAIGWRPGVYRSLDGGETWEDVSPTLDAPPLSVTLPPETNDPYIYVDQSTGRIFNFHMAPILTCSGLMSYSDDQGESWTTTPLGCGGEFPYDHQTIVAAKPRFFSTDGYPNVLIQCVNAVHSEMCSRSLDGGFTWMPANVAYPNEHLAAGYGTQTGHLAAALDGTVYLPTPQGATEPAVYVSKDDGLNWEQRVITTEIAIPFVDPAVAVDEEGNVYAAFIDRDGNLFYSVSSDEGVTWTPPLHVAEGITAHMPSLDVGDPGKVVISFPGTDDLPDGYATDGYPTGNSELVNAVEWDAYFAISYDALGELPTFQAVKANHDGPLVRRAACTRSIRCRYFIDFLDVEIGPDGRPYAAFVRGCTGACLTNPDANNNEGGTGLAIMATLESGPSLCETGCPWKFGAAGY